MRGVTGSLVTVALVAAFAFALPATALAQDMAVPADSCIGIVHFPDDPIGDAPSKMIVGVVMPPEYAGDDFTFELSGASGDQVGTGIVGPNGLAFAEAPLYSYGPHQITKATVSNAAVTPIDPTTIGDGGSYVVDDTQPVCDETVLTPLVVRDNRPQLQRPQLQRPQLQRPQLQRRAPQRVPRRPKRPPWRRPPQPPQPRHRPARVEPAAFRGRGSSSVVV